ncbi:MAG: DinB family protein [Phycisphaerales bacterium]
MTSDPIEILLAHHDWANRTLIERCKSLSREQFHQKFPMGRGSLHDTIVHTISATSAWTNMLMERPFEKRLEADPARTCEEILTLHAETQDALAVAARAKPLTDIAQGERAGRKYSFTRGGVLTHVFTHAMHHRAQALNMLRQLGDEAPPDVSVLVWMLTKDTNA